MHPTVVYLTKKNISDDSGPGSFLPSVRVAFIFLLICVVIFPTEIFASDDPLVIGIFPRRNVKQTHSMFAPLASYLTQKLGREVQLKTAKNFATFRLAMKRKEYDLVHLNQYQYVVANDELGYHAIAKNVEFGESTIAGALMVRSDSGMKTIQDLRGKKILFGGGPGAMVSYIVPTYMLRDAGLNKGDYIEAFAKNPPNAIISTYHGQADAAGVGDIALQLGMVHKAIDADKMTYLIRSEPLPHLPWAVKDDMPQETREKIQKIMTGLKDSPSGKAVLDSMEMSDMQPVTDGDYDHCREIIRQVYPGGGP